MQLAQIYKEIWKLKMYYDSIDFVTSMRLFISGFYTASEA